jgi:hypothetical protein
MDADATWTYRQLPSVGEWLTEVHTDLESRRATVTGPDRLAATGRPLPCMDPLVSGGDGRVGLYAEFIYPPAPDLR